MLTQVDSVIVKLAYQQGSLGALIKLGLSSEGPITYQSRSEVHNAFRANQEIDDSSTPEPPMTQPHGGEAKIAMGGTTFGMGQTMRAPAVTGLGALKPPKPPMAPKAPQAPKPSDSPMHAISSNVSGLDSMASLSSPQRRLSGSVI